MPLSPLYGLWWSWILSIISSGILSENASHETEPSSLKCLHDQHCGAGKVIYTLSWYIQTLYFSRSSLRGLSTTDHTEWLKNCYLSNLISSNAKCTGLRISSVSYLSSSQSANASSSSYSASKVTLTHFHRYSWRINCTNSQNATGCDIFKQHSLPQ